MNNPERNNHPEFLVKKELILLIFDEQQTFLKSVRLSPDLKTIDFVSVLKELEYPDGFYKFKVISATIFFDKELRIVSSSYYEDLNKMTFDIALSLESGDPFADIKKNSFFDFASSLTLPRNTVFYDGFSVFIEIESRELNYLSVPIYPYACRIHADPNKDYSSIDINNVKGSLLLINSVVNDSLFFVSDDEEYPKGKVLGTPNFFLKTRYYFFNTYTLNSWSQEQILVKEKEPLPTWVTKFEDFVYFGSAEELVLRLIEKIRKLFYLKQAQTQESNPEKKKNIVNEIKLILSSLSRYELTCVLSDKQYCELIPPKLPNGLIDFDESSPTTPWSLWKKNIIEKAREYDFKHRTTKLISFLSSAYQKGLSAYERRLFELWSECLDGVFFKNNETLRNKLHREEFSIYSYLGTTRGIASFLNQFNESKQWSQFNQTIDDFVYRDRPRTFVPFSDNESVFIPFMLPEGESDRPLFSLSFELFVKGRYAKQDSSSNSILAFECCGAKFFLKKEQNNRWHSATIFPETVPGFFVQDDDLTTISIKKIVRSGEHILQCSVKNSLGEKTIEIPEGSSGVSFVAGNPLVPLFKIYPSNIPGIPDSYTLFQYRNIRFSIGKDEQCSGGIYTNYELENPSFYTQEELEFEGHYLQCALILKYTIDKNQHPELIQQISLGNGKICLDTEARNCAFQFNKLIASKHIPERSNDDNYVRLIRRSLVVPGGKLSPKILRRLKDIFPKKIHIVGYPEFLSPIPYSSEGLPWLSINQYLSAKNFSLFERRIFLEPKLESFYNTPEAKRSSKIIYDHTPGIALYDFSGTNTIWSKLSMYLRDNAVLGLVYNPGPYDILVHNYGNDSYLLNIEGVQPATKEDIIGEFSSKEFMMHLKSSTTVPFKIDFHSLFSKLELSSKKKISVVQSLERSSLVTNIGRAMQEQIILVGNQIDDRQIESLLPKTVEVSQQFFLSEDCESLLDISDSVVFIDDNLRSKEIELPGTGVSFDAMSSSICSSFDSMLFSKNLIEITGIDRMDNDTLLSRLFLTNESVEFPSTISTTIQIRKTFSENIEVSYSESSMLEFAPEFKERLFGEVPFLEHAISLPNISVVIEDDVQQGEEKDYGTIQPRKVSALKERILWLFSKLFHSLKRGNANKISIKEGYLMSNRIEDTFRVIEDKRIPSVFQLTIRTPVRNSLAQNTQATTAIQSTSD